MNLRWKCIKNFMNSQLISCHVQLLEAILKKENVFLSYKNSKFSFSLKLKGVSIFQGSGISSNCKSFDFLDC